MTVLITCPGTIVKGLQSQALNLAAVQCYLVWYWYGEKGRNLEAYYVHSVMD